MPPPSLSVAAICAQLGARLPVPFCPACVGGAYRNAKRLPHKQNTDSVQSSPTHKPTLKHLLLTGLLSLVLPWGKVGVGQGERHTAVAPRSLLCRPAPIALFFSVSTKGVYNEWCHLDKVI